MLTKKEKWIKETEGGCVSFTEQESTYPRLANEKVYVTFPEFRRMLKAINSHFEVLFCDEEMPSHLTKGHQIIFITNFKDEASGTVMEGIIPICRVGQNRNNRIFAEMQGHVAEYGEEVFGKYGIVKEKSERANWWRGYLTALDICRQKWSSIKSNGIRREEFVSMEELGYWKPKFKDSLGNIFNEEVKETTKKPFEVNEPEILKESNKEEVNIKDLIGNL